MNNTLNTVGRIVYSLPLIGFGLGHLSNAAVMSGMVPSYFPGGIFWIYITGLAMLAAAVSIIFEKKTKLACYLLAAMLLIFILTLHLPGMGSSDAMAKQMSMMSLFKDLGLLGGALVIASKY